MRRTVILHRRHLLRPKISTHQRNQPFLIFHRMLELQHELLTIRPNRHHIRKHIHEPTTAIPFQRKFRLIPRFQQLAIQPPNLRLTHHLKIRVLQRKIHRQIDHNPVMLHLTQPNTLRNRPLRSHTQELQAFPAHKIEQSPRPQNILRLDQPQLS